MFFCILIFPIFFCFCFPFFFVCLFFPFFFFIFIFCSLLFRSSPSFLCWKRLEYALNVVGALLLCKRPAITPQNLFQACVLTRKYLSVFLRFSHPKMNWLLSGTGSLWTLGDEAPMPIVFVLAFSILPWLGLGWYFGSHPYLNLFYIQERMGLYWYCSFHPY